MSLSIIFSFSTRSMLLQRRIQSLILLLQQSEGIKIREGVLILADQESLGKSPRYFSYRIENKSKAPYKKHEKSSFFLRRVRAIEFKEAYISVFHHIRLSLLSDLAAVFNLGFISTASNKVFVIKDFSANEALRYKKEKINIIFAKRFQLHILLRGENKSKVRTTM